MVQPTVASCTLVIEAKTVGVLPLREAYSRGYVVLARQALNGRLAERQAVQERVATWQQERNQAHAGIDWRFTAADARIKLKHLYPTIK